MKKYLGMIIAGILFELAKFTANSACVGMLFQPEESTQIKSLSQLDDWLFYNCIKIIIK